MKLRSKHISNIATTSYSINRDEEELFTLGKEEGKND
jgi:hypothetical protein